MALTATSESSLTSSLGQLCRSNRLCQQQEQSCPAVACDDTRRLHEARRLPMALPTASSVSVAAVINYNSIPIASGVAHTTPDYRPVAAHVNGCCGILSGRPADEQSLYNCRCWPSTTGYPHHRSSVALGCLSTSSNWNRPPASLHHNNTQNESSGGKVLIVRRRMSAEGVKLHHNVHCELHQQGAISDGDSSGPFDGCSRDSDKFRLMVVPMQSSGSFAMSNCASPPVSPFHRRLSGVLTSSGWRPKLSRAVSEYSLYGRRMADARDYQRTCCGNIGWRSATDDDSPPRIVPISGQLSKVSLPLIMLAT